MGIRQSPGRKTPGNARGGMYGVIRLRMMLDRSRDELLRFEVYDPSTQGWVEVSKEEAEGIADYSMLIGGGFLPSGFHFIYAMPRARLGKYGKYVAEWIRGWELPRRPVLIDEGVEVKVPIRR